MDEDDDEEGADWEMIKLRARAAAEAASAALAAEEAYVDKIADVYSPPPPPTATQMLEPDLEIIAVDTSAAAAAAAATHAAAEAKANMIATYSPSLPPTQSKRRAPPSLEAAASLSLNPSSTLPRTRTPSPRPNAASRESATATVGYGVLNEKASDMASDDEGDESGPPNGQKEDTRGLRNKKYDALHDAESATGAATPRSGAEEGSPLSTGVGLSGSARLFLKQLGSKAQEASQRYGVPHRLERVVVVLASLLLGAGLMQMAMGTAGMPPAALWAVVMLGVLLARRGCHPLFTSQRPSLLPAEPPPPY